MVCSYLFHLFSFGSPITLNAFHYVGVVLFDKWEYKPRTLTRNIYSVKRYADVVIQGAGKVGGVKSLVVCK